MLTLVRGTDPYLVRSKAKALAHGSAVIDCAQENAHELLERARRYVSIFDQETIAVSIGGKTDDNMQADKTITVEMPTGPKLIAWIDDYCHERGATIEPLAARQLARWFPSDFWHLSCELDKLTAHPGPITESLVHNLVTPTVGDRDMWAISNSVSRGDRRRTIIALWDALADGAAPEYLVGMVGAGLRKRAVSGDQSVIAIHKELANLDRAFKQGTADAVDGLFAIALNL